MLLAFAIGFLVIISFIVSTMMASFIPFLQSFSGTEDYYSSYYGAVSSMERGLLATKYKKAGFVGSGGWDSHEDSEYIANFGDLSSGSSEWFIDSRSKAIGQGYDDYLYATASSSGANQIGYYRVQTIALQLDDSYLPYTNASNISETNIDVIEGGYKLPEKVIDFFDDNSGDVDIGLPSSIAVGENKKREKNGIIFVIQDGFLHIWIEDATIVGGGRAPFLDYNIEFSDDVGSTTYNIQTTSSVGDYSVQLEATKDTYNIITPKFKGFLFPTW